MKAIEIPPCDQEKEHWNIIIETPKGSRTKYSYEKEYDIYRLKGLLPLGMSFPYDFGFIPQTHGEDGDALDILVLMDEAAYPGCLVAGRIIGAIKAEQTEKNGETVRNDRLIAVAEPSFLYRYINDISDLSEDFIKQIEQFFMNYNQLMGKKFKPIGHLGAKGAEGLVKEAQS